MGEGLTCGPHEVQQQFGLETICHFEEGFCGTPVGNIALCPGAFGQGVCAEGHGYLELDVPGLEPGDWEIEMQVTFDHLPGEGEPGAALLAKYGQGSPAELEFWLGVAGEGARAWRLCGGEMCIESPPGMVEEGILYCVHAGSCEQSPSNPRGDWIFLSVAPEGGEMEEIAAGGFLLPGLSTSPMHVAGSPGSPFHGQLDELRVGWYGCPNPVEPATWGAIKHAHR